MAYRIDPNTNELIIDGFEEGIASSPYKGIANIRNLNTSYYPGVAYTNYKRLAATLSTSGTTFWYAGAHSTNVADNSGWLFEAQVSSMTNPVQHATSPNGINYILDDSGQVWKQSAANSTTFNLLGDAGRFTNGAGGIAYWQNYLAVFGNGDVEFCGDGTGDSGITGSNWNKNTTTGMGTNVFTFVTHFGSSPTHIFAATPAFFFETARFLVNDPIQFTTTGTLPTGLSLNTTYYVLTVSADYAYITVSATVGGAAISVSDDGTGTHTVTDTASILPIANCTGAAFSGGNFVGVTTLTISSYVNPEGLTVTGTWAQPSGLYNIVMPNGQKLPASFTYGSATVSMISPIIYIIVGTFSIQFLDPTVTSYRPYVSKVDGSLYFCNGQFIGRIATSTSPNIQFDPSVATSYSISFGVTSIPESLTDTVVDMTDLKSTLIVAGQKDIYTWDYVSASTSSPSPVGEKISRIYNVLNNIYVLAGQKGSVYVSNGYSAQLMYKLPDYISGSIDPVWSFGGVMFHRAKLVFQALAKSTSGTNLLAGIFSLVVSPALTGEVASGLVMEAQNSYGLTPAAGALSNGILMDNQQWSTGVDSYYSAWSNGATVGGIDYNDGTLWQNFEPLIETDIVPIGTVLDIKSLGNIHFKLDRPMTTGDQIRVYWRPSLSDSYTLIGTTTTTVLAAYYPSNITNAQWAQFEVQFACASSGSSRIPLREIRIQTQ